MVVFSRDWVIVSKGVGFMSLKEDWCCCLSRSIWSRMVGCD